MSATLETTISQLSRICALNAICIRPIPKMVEEMEAIEFIRIIRSLMSMMITRKPCLYAAPFKRTQTENGIQVFCLISLKIRTSLKAFCALGKFVSNRESKMIRLHPSESSFRFPSVEDFNRTHIEFLSLGSMCRSFSVSTSHCCSQSMEVYGSKTMGLFASFFCGNTPFCIFRRESR